MVTKTIAASAATTPAGETLGRFLEGALPALETLIDLGDRTWAALNKPDLSVSLGLAGGIDLARTPLGARFRYSGDVAAAVGAIVPSNRAAAEIRDLTLRAERDLTAAEQRAREEALIRRTEAQMPDPSLVSALGSLSPERLEEDIRARVHDGDAMGAYARLLALGAKFPYRAQPLTPLVETALDASDPDRAEIAGNLARELGEIASARELVRQMAETGYRLAGTVTGEFPALKSQAEGLAKLARAAA